MTSLPAGRCGLLTATHRIRERASDVAPLIESDRVIVDACDQRICFGDSALFRKHEFHVIAMRGGMFGLKAKAISCAPAM
jgi:hypothetical protein